MLPDLLNKHFIHRFIRFAVVAVVVGAVNFSLLAVLKGYLAAPLAFTIAFFVGTSLHYCLNRFWALRSARHDTAQQMGEYLLTVAVSYALNFFFFMLGHSVFKLDPLWAAMVAFPPAGVAVFLLLNFRVFREKV